MNMDDVNEIARKAGCVMGMAIAAKNAAPLPGERREQDNYEPILPFVQTWNVIPQTAITYVIPVPSYSTGFENIDYNAAGGFIEYGS